MDLNPMLSGYTAMWRQTEATAYLNTKQIQLFTFAQHNITDWLGHLVHDLWDTLGKW